MRYIALIGVFLIPLFGLTTDGGVTEVMKVVPGVAPEQIRTVAMLAVIAILIVLASVCPWQLSRCIIRREYVIFAANLVGSIVGVLGLSLLAFGYIMGVIAQNLR